MLKGIKTKICRILRLRKFILQKYQPRNICEVYHSIDWWDLFQALKCCEVRKTSMTNDLFKELKRQVSEREELKKKSTILKHCKHFCPKVFIRCSAIQEDEFRKVKKHKNNEGIRSRRSHIWCHKSIVDRLRKLVTISVDTLHSNKVQILWWQQYPQKMYFVRLYTHLLYVCPLLKWINLPSP